MLKCAEVLLVKIAHHGMVLTWSTLKIHIPQLTTNIQSLTLIEEFGQACMEGELHHEIDGTATPVINPPGESLSHSKIN